MISMSNVLILFPVYNINLPLQYTHSISMTLSMNKT